MKKSHVPLAVVRRMPRYYRHLEALKKNGVKKISSAMLSMRTGLKGSQIRQDFSNFGAFGRQGYGYEVTELMGEIANVLGMNNGYRAVIVGVGRMARALLDSFPLKEYGVTIDALYDIDPELVGTKINGIPVYHVDQMHEHCAIQPVDFGILTASVDVAQTLANIMAECGVKGIWNFTNVELSPRAGNPVIEDVHFFDSLFSLCCLMNEYENDSMGEASSY